MVLQIHLEMEAALSSLPALLSLIGINKRCLPLGSSVCSYIQCISMVHVVSKGSYWAIGSDKFSDKNQLVRPIEWKCYYNGFRCR